MKRIIIGAGLVILSITALAIFTGTSAPHQEPGGKKIETILSDVSNGGALYDVRTVEEFAAGHIEGSTNVPLQNIQAGKIPPLDPGNVIYVYCRSGSRSSQAKALLENAGFTNVIDLGAMSEVQSIGGKITS